MSNDEIDSWLCDIKSSKDAATAIKLTRELKAAREVVAYFREWNDHSDECDIHQENLPCDCGYYKDLEVLKKYDEARQG